MRKLSKALANSSKTPFLHFLSILILGFLYVFFTYSSFSHFFVGDDYSWLRWASESNTKRLLLNFIDAQGFFLRPFPKLLIYIEYSFFGLNPIFYHVVNILLNFLTSIASYFLFIKIFKKTYIAFLGAIVFSFIPSHSQNLFWIATISTTLSTFFIFLGLLFFYNARAKRSLVGYFVSSILFFCSVFSYENAVIFILLTLVFDLFIVNKKYLGEKFIRVFPYMVNGFIIVFYLLVRSHSQAAGFSGDYNYNLSRVIPNTIGNYLGYVLVFFASENSLWFYNFLRTSLKSYALIFSVLGFFLLAAIGGFFLEHKEKIRISRRARLFAFGFLFSVASLFPYLPLGNITLRYVYLPSFGFVIMLLVFIEKIFSLFINDRKQPISYAFLSVCVLSFFFFGLTSAEGYWKNASNISYNTFKSLGSYSVKDEANFYFYNVPIRTGEAYIFPVGLPDAVYFAQNHKQINTFIVGDYQTVKKLINPRASNYVFTFDKNFVMKKIE